MGPSWRRDDKGYKRRPIAQPPYDTDTRKHYAAPENFDPKFKICALTPSGIPER